MGIGQYWHWIDVMSGPTLEGMDIHAVRAAQRTLSEHLPPTPAWGAPALDEVVGARVVLKHEQTQPTGAFKVRGGLNLLAGMSPAERAAGVVSASTGNHGQSLAYAAHRYGARCRIVLPEPANPTKLRALRGWGAELVLHGTTMERPPPPTPRACFSPEAGETGRRPQATVGLGGRAAGARVLGPRYRAEEGEARGPEILRRRGGGRGSTGGGGRGQAW